jgi:hypothetical protein
MDQYTANNVPTPWIGERKLVEMLSSVIVDSTSLNVESYRLVSQKLQKYCHKQAPAFTHCMSYTSDGMCQCSAMFRNPTELGATCTSRNPSLRNCVQADGSGDSCKVCKAGYYVVGALNNGSFGDVSDNETHNPQSGECRRGTEQCSIDCPYCDTPTTCAVKQAPDTSYCNWAMAANPTTCFQCKDGFALTANGSCHAVEEAGCARMDYDTATGNFVCTQCKGNYRATFDSNSAAHFKCELVEDLNKDYAACVHNRPGSFVKEKWYQVIWSKDISQDDSQIEYWNNVETSTQFTISEQELVKATGYDHAKIDECRRKVPGTQEYGSYDAQCVRLLASRNRDQAVAAKTVPFEKIYYRGIVRLFRKGTYACPDRPGETCIHYDYDQDFLTATLMWSQIGIWGPWLHIPYGCPVINAKPPPPVVEPPCTYYSRVGKSIKAAANFARFVGKNTYERTDASVHTESVQDIQSEFSSVFENAPGATTNQTKDPMARCLLNRLETISETRDVQCLFEAFKPTQGGWVKGLPDGINLEDIKDCKHMSDMFQHGENCFQTIVVQNTESNVIKACNDFLTHFPTAKHYGQCVNKCGTSFRNNYGKWGYNDHLNTNWNSSHLHEERDNDNGAIARSGDYKAAGPGSYDFCQMNLWDSWDLCEVFEDDKDVKKACNKQCRNSYAKFTVRFDKFKALSGMDNDSTPEDNFDTLQALNEKWLSELQLLRTERDLLARNVDELRDTQNVELDRQVNEKENFDPALLEDVTAELDKTARMRTNKEVEIENLLKDWTDYVKATYDENSSEFCPQTSQWTPYEANGHTYKDGYNVNSDFATFMGKYDSYPGQAKCGNGSGDGTTDGRLYCGEHLPFCCDTEVTMMGDNNQTVKKGMCYKDNKHANCTFNGTNGSANVHFSMQNIFACDLRRHKSDHKTLWAQLQGVYQAFGEYKDCVTNYGSNPPVAVPPQQPAEPENNDSLVENTDDAVVPDNTVDAGNNVTPPAATNE